MKLRFRIEVIINEISVSSIRLIGKDLINIFKDGMMYNWGQEMGREWKSVIC